MINAAVKILERYADTRFIEATYLEYHDRFPNDMNTPWWDGVKEGPISMINANANFIRLAQGPVNSVVAFNTYADDGVPQLFAASNYVVDTVGDFGRIALKLGGTWPVTILRELNGIEIEYKVGLSTTATDCPDAIKEAVLLMIARMYEKRGDENVESIPSRALTLLEPYRRFKMLC